MRNCIALISTILRFNVSNDMCNKVHILSRKFLSLLLRHRHQLGLCASDSLATCNVFDWSIVAAVLTYPSLLHVYWTDLSYSECGLHRCYIQVMTDVYSLFKLQSLLSNENFSESYISLFDGEIWRYKYLPQLICEFIPWSKTPSFISLNAPFYYCLGMQGDIIEMLNW